MIRKLVVLQTENSTGRTTAEPNMIIGSYLQTKYTEIHCINDAASMVCLVTRWSEGRGPVFCFGVFSI